jgi:NAD(P)-dependent dehydrogenase (short-subunit alcohol dehydrogenase family)
VSGATASRSARGNLFFVSPMSSWVTGQTLSIDGGPGLGGAIADD